MHLLRKLFNINIFFIQNIKPRIGLNMPLSKAELKSRPQHWWIWSRKKITKFFTRSILNMKLFTSRSAERNMTDCVFLWKQQNYKAKINNSVWRDKKCKTRLKLSLTTSPCYLAGELQFIMNRKISLWWKEKLWWIIRYTGFYYDLYRDWHLKTFLVHLCI